MAIDRIDWHADSAIEEGLGWDNAGTHIGIYLAWIVQNNLVGEIHLEESAEELQLLKDRKITGRDYLIELCDEKFWEEDLNAEGLAFTQYYYEGDAIYFGDYEEVLAQHAAGIYHVKNTWENYDVMAKTIDERYQAWKLSKSIESK